MNQPDQVCRIQFIPKNETDSLRTNSKNILTHYMSMSEFTVGSGKDASIVYKSKGVHAIHAKIKIKGRDIYVTDLFSSKGVVVNGRKIPVGEPYPCKAGEYIHLGNATDLITIEIYRRPMDPKQEGEQLLHDAETTAVRMRKEADEIFKQASEVEEKTSEILREANDKANEIVLEKKRDMQKQYEEKLREAIEEGHRRAESVQKQAEKDAEEMRIEAENKAYELVQKREEEAKAITRKAEETAERLIQSGKNEVELLLQDARSKAKSIAAEGENRKKEALNEKENVSKAISELEAKRDRMKSNMAELNKENEESLKENANYIAEAKRIREEFEQVSQDFKQHKEKLDAERADIDKQMAEAKTELADQQAELNQTMAKNAATKKDTRAVELRKRDMNTQIQKGQGTLKQIETDIEAARKERQQAQQDLIQEKKKTDMDIEALKKQFDDEYQKRKKNEEIRFEEIRKREQRAAEMRLSLLEKHDKDRVPEQIRAISSSIWNDLSTDIKTLSFGGSGSSDKSIPLAIEQIVKKAVLEEYDLRQKVSASVPIYLDEDGKKSSNSFHFSQGVFSSALGAMFTLFIVYSGFLVVQPATPSPTPQPREVASVKPKKVKPPKKEVKKLAQKSAQWRASYTENILYTKNFLSFINRQKTNTQLKGNLKAFLTNELNLDKESINQFILTEGALIWDLNNINKQARKSGNSGGQVQAMQAKEAELFSQLVSSLGGKANFDRYMEFQKSQYGQNR